MRRIEDVGFQVSHEENKYKKALEWCEKYLLRQGPLEYFVHHNTLHAFEGKEFFKALFEAKDLFGAQTHMPISWYQKEYSHGRINMDDQAGSLDQCCKYPYEFINILDWNERYEPIPNPLRNKFIEKLLKEKPETDHNYARVTTFWDFTKDSYRAKSLDKNLQDLKLRFLAAFFDKGTSYWEMEDRDKGFHHCFKQYLKYLPKTKLNQNLLNAYETLSYNEYTIYKSLEIFKKKLNIPFKYFDKYLFQVLNRSKGWTGLIYALNENPGFNPTHIIANKFDYIAFCLSFELAAYETLKSDKDLHFVTYEFIISNDYQFEILNYFYDSLNKELKDEDLTQKKFFLYKEELLTWNLQKLTRVWQEAYERHLYQDLINAHRQTLKSEKFSPYLQVVTCIDDREESTRRHFEEYSKSIETFGYAGHFGLNIKYRSLREAHFRALCPVNANPTKYVYEEVRDEEKLSFQKLATLKHFLFHNSNLPLVGSILSLFLGPFTGMLFLFENLAPRKVHSLRKKLKKIMYPPIPTQLNYWNREDNKLEGFTDQELADVASNMILITGMNKSWGQVVFLCGHGSKSMNNPHGAAYNCGACAGGKGAPNARLMATALNKESVRELLKERDILIPENTIFVGGYHCTSTGKILTFEDTPLNEEQRKFLEDSCHYVEKKDAKERMRKFENVSLSISGEEAFLAAQNRSYDFSQPRPEYGHNTNAFCLVGKRDTNKSIFMDRRAFLVSYENENDPKGDNLLALLSAVIPVCAGISLEYYFSFVDQDKFGAGVKQAHNVVSLLGVMNGYQSDLQMGLPWQMVEIHEPARITFLIEADRSKFERVLKKNIEVRNLVKNEWVRLILKEPEGDYLLYGTDEPRKISPLGKNKKVYKSSEEIYRGKRKILNIALKGEVS